MKKHVSLAFLLTASFFANAQLSGILKELKSMSDSINQQQETPQAQQPSQHQNNSVNRLRTSGAIGEDFDINTITKRILSIVAVPNDASYTANDWLILKELFPSINFLKVKDNIYTDAKTTKLKNKLSEITVTAKGARSMIFNVEAEAYNRDGNAFGFKEYLDKNKATNKVCVVDESASSSEIYYEYSDEVIKSLIKYTLSAGSGGVWETISLGNQLLPKECKINKPSKLPSVQSTASVEVKGINIGYLKGTIKTTETYGCSYVLRSDGKKKRQYNQVGGDSADDSGVVINIDGQDVLVKGKYDGKGIFSGNFSSYQLTIPKTKSSFDFANSSGYKISISVVGQCGD